MSQYCLNCMKLLKGAKKCQHCGFEGGGQLAPHQLKPGTMLGSRYRIGRVIGEGGFGITYIGLDTRLDMRVAVKEYYLRGYANRYADFSNDVTITDQKQKEFFKRGKEKFLSEAKALAEFHDHVGIVDVRDFFEANQTAYIVMEYLEGQNLMARLKASVFSVQEILALMPPIFDALERVHTEHIIHRDISPDNIMLLKDGTLKLLDFGAAREVDYDDPKSISVVLKNGYAPPEQYRPKGEQGPWTDIYALCATIYKCLTQKTPVNALEREVRDEMEWPSELPELQIEITAGQEAVLKKGMAVKREDRYQSVAELREAFLRADEEAHSQDAGHMQEEAHSQDIGYMQEGSDAWRIEGPSEKQGPAPGKQGIWGKDKRRLVFVLALAAVLAVTFFGYFRHTKKGDGVSKKTNATADANTKADIDMESNLSDGTENPLSFYDEKTMYYVTLQADEEMSVKEFNEGAEIIRGRLDMLADGEAYAMQVHDDMIEFAMPKSCFGDLAVEKALRCYISRALDLFAFNNAENVGFTYPKPAWVQIGRDDIESVELLDGRIEGVDATEYGYENETYPYLQIVLSDKCAKAHRSEIKEWGDSFAFGQDMDRHEPWYYYYTFPQGDGKTFFVLNDDGEKYNRILEYNLMHDTLSDSFTFIVEMNGVAWENVGDTEDTGRNQCNVDGLGEDTVSILYTAYSADEWTDGEWLDMKKALKGRLDALGQPYAFGLQETEEDTRIVIRTSVLHMGWQVMDWLVSSAGSVELRSGLMRYFMWGTSMGKISSRAEKNQPLDISLEIGNYSSENKGAASELKRFTKYLLKENQNVLTLFVGGMPFCNATIKEPIMDGIIHFDELCTAEGENAGWMANLLEAICNGPSLPKVLSFHGGQFDRNRDGTRTSEEQFAVRYPQMEELESKIQQIIPEAEVSFSNTEIYVKLHLNVDETLPAQAVSLVKEIYTESAFEECGYRSLSIYLLDEDNREFERARMFFSKSYIGEEDKHMAIHGKVTLSGYFRNGRLERYKEAFRDLVETDSFYTGMDADWSFEEEKEGEK